MTGSGGSERLLRAKFAVPGVPTATVPRPRLFATLETAVKGPLTLVTAPAGAGKTALVSSWIGAGRPPGDVAWLTLAEDDADRRRFWRALIEALARAAGDEALESLAVSPREPFQRSLVLPSVAAALDSRDQPVVLVLDDFHEVASSVSDDVAQLIRFAAPALRTIVLARADPELGQARLRLEGRLSEIHADQLAFSLEETEELFDALRVDVAPDDLAALWRHTEGWAAALRLAALSLRGHPEPAAFIEGFAGTDATVREYLVSEVLARQPSELRGFLLRTSIGDVISADLADAILDGSNADELLDRIRHSGVPITPLDDHGLWYRYHPLFAELLRAQARSELGDELRELHGRAAAWFGAHGDNAAALRHAAMGEAWDLAWQLAVDSWVHLLMNGEISALDPLLAAMPLERVEACPELTLAFAGAMLERADPAAAQPFLRRAQSGADLVPAERRSEFLATLAATRLYEGRFLGDPREALRAARKLLADDVPIESQEVSTDARALLYTQLGIVELWTGELVSATHHLERAHAAALERGHDWTALTASTHLAHARAFRGEIGRAVRHAREAVVIAERRGWARSEPAGSALLVLAGEALYRGQLDEATRRIARAYQVLRETREPSLRAIHALLRAMLFNDSGEPASALDVIQATREANGNWPLLAPLESMLVTQEALARAAIGERAAARAMLEDANNGSPTSLPVAAALAKLQLLEGDPHDARATLAPHLAGSGSGTGWIEAWLIDALSLEALGESGQAARSLERALDRAEDTGLIRDLVVDGNLLRPLLLRQMRSGTSHPAVVSQVLEAMESREHPSLRPRPALIQPLSERERAILHYLPTWKTNREIAAELFVSINTVKSHLKSIYRKLDANGRRDAIARARDLGLLP